MRVSVTDQSDFVDKLFGVKGGVLDVLFSSAVYEDAVFNIACDSGFSQIILRGEAPTTLVDSSVNVCADELELYNLLFDTRRISNAVLTTRMKDQVTIGQCAWLRAFLSDEPGLSILHVAPRSSAAQLALQDSWFIGNLTVPGHQIVELGAMTSAAFSSLAFTRTAFIDNRADNILAALSATEINIQDCFVWLRENKTIFLGARTRGAEIVFADCTLITPSLGQLATQWAADAAPGDFNPVRFERCHIYVTGEVIVPDTLKLVDSAVKKVPAMSDDEFAVWVQSWEAAAREGLSPDTVTLRESLNLN